VTEDQARSERATQDRVIERFKQWGYEYLGNWHTHEGNCGIETALLRANLGQRGYEGVAINAALQKLQRTAELAPGSSAYAVNEATYQLLRYGVKVQIGDDKRHETVHLIDWQQAENNHFALAEEVTLKAKNTRRPDIVLYINGMAVAVLELKSASVGISKAINQLISLQGDEFNPQFFSSVQLLLAGNDSEGLYCGTTDSEAQYFVQWKDESPKSAEKPQSGVFLDRPLRQLCERGRLLDLLHNFVVFDGGKKKIPRWHQLQGLLAARQRLKKREGGVIYHTQGSGKSILMVLLAKWLLENNPKARVMIVTDRDELDRQIENVMQSAGIIGEGPTPRVTSRADLLEKLKNPAPRLLCTLLHKFELGESLKQPCPPVAGEFYVFVDECHRTQGGDMHRQMKRWLQDAVFIGFSGTPLLKGDKTTTWQVFGHAIHRYQFPQAVKDKVVLDLKYGARDVPQRMTSPEKINQWFERKTQGLSAFQKHELRHRYATIERLMSSKERKEKIIADIIEDFENKPRLNNNRGTAILVAHNIYDACHYFRLFKEQDNPLRNKVGIVTSYVPNAAALADKPAGSDEHFQYEIYKKYVISEGRSAEDYEQRVKHLFIKEPANMKLLIVVGKLLTGFDAPSCTYIYLDSNLKEHNLFQAICRTNRLDGVDKQYGHVVDYQKQFHRVEEAIAVYSADELEPDDIGDNEDIGENGDGNPILKDWLEEGRKQLESSREQLHQLCEPVAVPRAEEQFILYFCGSSDKADELQAKQSLRFAFYKSSAQFVRNYAAIAADLAEAGYSEGERKALKQEADFYGKMRDTIKLVSNEELDTAPYEEDMRYLINTYISADPSRRLGNLDELPLLELIVESGLSDAIAQKFGQEKPSQATVTEAIINNVRKTIIRERLNDPSFYQKMSDLLEELLQQIRQGAQDYEQELLQLVKTVVEKKNADDLPPCLKNQPQAQWLYRNLPAVLEEPAGDDQVRETSADYGDALASLALRIHEVMHNQAERHWRGNPARERYIQSHLHAVCGENKERTEKLFNLLKGKPEFYP